MAKYVYLLTLAVQALLISSIGIKKRIMQEAQTNAVSVCNRVRVSGTAPIYLQLDDGLHHIPNPETYNNLFTNWNDVLEVPDLAGLSVAEPLSDGATIRADGPAQFLVSNG